MIHITITATGSTVAEALANARNIAFPLRPGSQLILDGSVRPIHRGDNRIGTISATAETDVEKIAHYTGKEQERADYLANHGGRHDPTNI